MVTGGQTDSLLIMTSILMQVISGVSLGSAIVLASSFSSRREIVLASATTLRGKGIGDSLADRLVNFFKHQFRPGLTDMAPL